MKPIAPDVWHLEAPAPMRFPGGVRMPLASTVVRLPDRTLLVYSPVALDDTAVAALSAEGEVAHIVAPSLIHHLYAKAAVDRFPRATLHATPGLAAKVPVLAGARELTTPDPTWGDAIDLALIAGAPKLNETVLFHRPSGTLMCADLLFNVTTHASFMTRVILGMMGVGGKRLAQSRVWKLAVRDRAAARAALDRVLGWPIERVSPAHGEPVATSRDELALRMARAYGGTAKALLAAAT